MKEGGQESRVLLDKEASHDLFEMVEEVKVGGSFVQITPSKLASWIITRYRRRSYHKEKSVVARAHFDHQKHLKESLKSATTKEQLRETLAEAMRQVGRKRKA